MSDPCAACGHPRSDHVASLFGVACVGYTATDLPDWVSKGTPCKCQEFKEPA